MKKIEEFNCIVTVIDGVLHQCGFLADGSPDMWAGSLNWSRVTGPVDQKFIDAVNAALNATFTVAEFEKKGILTSSRGKIHINKPEALRSIVEKA
jgi:hypothetical protein